MSNIIAMPAPATPAKKRWSVNVSYGPGDQEGNDFDSRAHTHHFAVDELFEVDEKIERGPDFTRIKEILIRYALNDDFASDEEPSDEELIAALNESSQVDTIALALDENLREALFQCAKHWMFDHTAGPFELAESIFDVLRQNSLGARLTRPGAD